MPLILQGGSLTQELACSNGAQSIVKRSLLIFCRCVVALTAIAWAACLISARVFHRGYPFSSFVFAPEVRFTDLTDLYAKIRNLGSGGQALASGLPLINYPAPALYVYAFFIRLFPQPVLAFILFTAVATLIALLLLRRKLVGSGTDDRLIDLTLLTTAVCSYPFMYLIDRANLEGVVWVFVVLGLILFVDGRFLTSSLFFAAAVCIKPFPILFFFIFLRRRRYKEIGIAFAAICVTNLAALKAVGPSIPIALRALQPGTQSYFNNYIVAFRSLEETFDHSVFSCIKQIVGLGIGKHLQYVPNGELLRAYMIWLPVGGAILIACGVYFWRKPVLNQLFAVVLLILLLPPISGDYALVELYLPWGVFIIFLIRDVGNGRIDFSLRKCLWILIPCAIVMTPQSYLTFQNGGFAGQVKALVLVLLLFAVARIDMPSSLFHELPVFPGSLSDMPDEPVPVVHRHTRDRRV